VIKLFFSFETAIYAASLGIATIVLRFGQVALSIWSIRTGDVIVGAIEIGLVIFGSIEQDMFSGLEIGPSHCVV